MDARESAEKTELERRFPSMRSVKSAPALFRLNGCGVGMYGRRDYDGETRTYVKTRCLCLVFVPIFPLDAYRVQDAGNRGWYFLGKEPVSGFGRGVRWCVIGLAAIALGGGGWSAYEKSPGRRVARARQHAAECVAQGRPLEAAETYREAMRQGIGTVAEWREAMAGVLVKEISSGDASRAAAAVAYADEKKVVPDSREPLLPDLAERALAAAEKNANPADAEKILSAFQPAPADLARVHEALRKSLESIHQAAPADEAVRIKLALIREEFGEVDGAIALLEPAKDQLGDGEGARLFGGLLLGEGRTAEALPYLERYVEPRLKDWQKKDRAVQMSYEAAQTRILDELNKTGGPSGFRSRYEAAAEDEQRRMVDDYLAGQVEQDAAFVKARDRYRASAKIIPAVMDLGVARLRSAQAETDLAKRKALLKEAEETFLSMKSAAGESDEYRLFLGQIYFWSGRESEGRKLFDELLESKQRDAATLYSLGILFRELGEDNDARKLLEEALPKADDDARRSEIIRLRSLLARTTDEKIEWLEKAKGADPQLVINLAEARGERAEEAGDRKKAMACFREALAGYDKQPRGTAALNNSALLYRSLYRLGGNAADFETGARLLSEAVEMDSTNAILTFNAADSLLSAAVMRTVGDRLDPKLKQVDMGLSALQYLYQREEEKEAVLAGLRADPNFRKGLGYFWNALLLSPKSINLYAWGGTLFQYLKDDASLERLLAKAAEQEFDFTAGREEYARHLSKESDPETKKSIKAFRERIDALEAELKDPRSKALSQALVASSRMSGFEIGEFSTTGDWLDQLRAAAKSAPCSRLNSHLEAGLETVALEKLEKDDPACAAIIGANRRLLGRQDILRLLVRSQGDLGKRVRAHPAVIDARTVTFNNHQLFPSSFGIEDWLLLEEAYPEAAAKMKELVLANRTDFLFSKLQREIQFEGPSAMLEQFWLKVLKDDAAGAREMLPKLAAAGVKMPPMF